MSHADGTIIVYDKDREDGTFTPQDPDTSPAYSDSDSENSGAGWNPRESMFVSMPPWHPASGPGIKPEKDKAVKNPVSHWRVSRRAISGMWTDAAVVQGLSMQADFVFSPDVKYVAAISEDGCLRVIDALAEAYAVHFLLDGGLLTK